METAVKKQSKAEEMRKRAKRKAYTRAGIQAIFFITMPSAFTAGFSGVKYLFQWMGAGEVLQLNSFVKVLIGLCLFTIVFGRYFCGYVCSFGSLGDLIYFSSCQIQTKVLKRKKPFQLPLQAIPWLQKLKYLNLLVIVVLCALGLYGNLSGTSAWDIFSRLAVLKGIPTGYLVGVLSLIIILAGMALESRFFCQFLCPMGAIFALLPILPFSQLKRDSDHCIKNCNICQRNCPAHLKLEQDGFRNGECFACEKCIAPCPKGNISQWSSRAGILKNELVAVLLKAVLFFAMGCYLGLFRFL